MRSLYWIAIAALLLLLTVLVALRGRTPFGKSNSGFAVEWIEEVDRIQIRDNEHSLIMERKGDDWVVNDSFVARSTAIDFILKTIERIEIKSPVSAELFDNLVGESGIEPLEVEVKGGRKVSNYYIYKPGKPDYGSIMRRSLRSKPYFVVLPAYDLDPGSHFVVDEKFWKPYHIFNLIPEQIRSIDIAYRDTEMDRLFISVDKDVEVRVNGTRLDNVGHNKVSRYLSYFTFVPFEQWALDLDSDQIKKITASDPEIVIEIELSDDNKLVAHFWSKLIETPDGPVGDTDRLYGSLNGGKDLFIVKYFDIDPLIKSGEYFISD